MKKILILFIGLVLSFVLMGQTKIQGKYVPNPNTIELVNITTNQVQSGWGLIGQSCLGCASYWYQIRRSVQPIRAEDGGYYYYYYFNFYSNSFYTNGASASTYLSQIFYYANGTTIFTSQYLLLPVGQNVWGAWIRLSQPTAAVSFRVTNISVH